MFIIYNLYNKEYLTLFNNPTMQHLRQSEAMAQCNVRNRASLQQDPLALDKIYHEFIFHDIHYKPTTDDIGLSHFIYKYQMFKFCIFGKFFSKEYN